MKKTLYSILTLSLLMGSVTDAAAQTFGQKMDQLFGTSKQQNKSVGNSKKQILGNSSQKSSDYEYNLVREAVLRGDQKYGAGDFSSAEFYYRQALQHNFKCTGKKFISEAELNKRISDTTFAIQNKGVTRQQMEEERRSAYTTKPVDPSQMQHYSCYGVSYDANVDYVKIKNVEVRPDATLVHCVISDLSTSTQVGIQRRAYIKDRTTGQKGILQKTDGIYTDHYITVYPGNTLDFTLTFPAISLGCHNIDVVEPDDRGWQFCNIRF